MVQAVILSWDSDLVFTPLTYIFRLIPLIRFSTKEPYFFHHAAKLCRGKKGYTRGRIVMKMLYHLIFSGKYFSKI